MLKKTVVLCACSVALLSTSLVMTSRSETARTAATQIASIYEPGRNPYQQTMFFNLTSSNCPTTYSCYVNFPAVPAHKRLVVTYASASFRLSTQSSDASISLGIDNVAGSPFIGLPTPGVSQSSGMFYTSASSITAYVDAGHQPTIFFSADSQGGITSGAQANASIVGYLVGIP